MQCSWKTSISVKENWLKFQIVLMGNLTGIKQKMHKIENNDWNVFAIHFCGLWEQVNTGERKVPASTMVYFLLISSTHKNLLRPLENRSFSSWAFLNIAFFWASSNLLAWRSILRSNGRLSSHLPSSFAFCKLKIINIIVNKDEYCLAVLATRFKHHLCTVYLFFLHLLGYTNTISLQWCNQYIRHSV